MNEIIRQLEKLDSASIQDGIANQFIEITKSSDEVVFFANSEGFIWLALQALKLANKAKEGSHLHIDESGLADYAETPLVLSYKNAKE